MVDTGFKPVACFHPLPAWQLQDGSVVFVERGNVLRSLLLPCGRCDGCRLERSRQWAVRCVHEQALHKRSCVITLTYDNDNCPSDGSLRYRDFQLFMKRFRKFAACRLRFFVCGEYGEDFGRPHFHACIFGFDFQDKLPWKVSGGRAKLWRSRSLEMLWPFGYSSIGELNFESAAYIARYCLKKVTGAAATDHYLDKSTGVVREAEFIHMSLKPGIGRGWIDKFESDVYPEGRVVVNGRKCKPPKYYDRVFASRGDSDELAEMQAARERFARERYKDATEDRLKVREQVVKARIKLFTRSL